MRRYAKASQAEVASKHSKEWLQAGGGGRGVMQKSSGYGEEVNNPHLLQYHYKAWELHGEIQVTK